MIDLFELLVVSAALKSLLKYYNSKASVLQDSVFLMIQLSHSYMTTGKTIAFPKGKAFQAQGTVVRVMS